jgi:hypothetical protein
MAVAPRSAETNAIPRGSPGEMRVTVVRQFLIILGRPTAKNHLFTTGPLSRSVGPRTTGTAVATFNLNTRDAVASRGRKAS